MFKYGLFFINERIFLFQLIKKIFIALFNLSFSNFCFSKLSYFDFSDSLGDGDTNCYVHTPSLSLSTKFIYKSSIKILDKGDIDISIHTDSNKEKCLNIVIDMNSQSVKKMCKLTESNEKYCKYKCYGTDYDQITITNFNSNIKFCEIRLSSKDRLINVCV